MKTCFSPSQKRAIKKVYKDISVANQDQFSIQEQIESINKLQRDLNGSVVFQEMKNRLIDLNKAEKSYAKITLTSKEKAYAGLDVIDEVIKIESEITSLLSDLEKTGYEGSLNKFGIKAKYDLLKSERKPGAKRLTNEEIVLNELIKKYEEKGYYSSELDNAIEANPNGVFSMLVLDGNKYIAIHSEDEARVFSEKTGYVTTVDFENKSMKGRNNTIKHQLSRALLQNFDEENATLGERLVHRVSLNNRIKEDGKVPIERTIISAKENVGLFGKMREVFDGLLDLDKTDKEAYIQKIGKISSFIPENIRTVLLGSGETHFKTQEFYNKFADFLTVYEEMEVPVEQVWNDSNWKINDKGELVQIKHSKYVAPNYLEFLGKKVSGRVADEKYTKLVLDPSISEIIRFYSVKAMIDMDEMIRDLQGSDTDTISKNLGISYAEAESMKRDFIENDTIPVSSVISDAAKDAFSQIGLSINSNSNIKIKAGIEASIKSLIQATMARSKYVEYTTFKSELAEFTADKTNDDASIKNEIDRLSKKYSFSKKFAMFKLNKEMFDIENNQDLNNVAHIMNKLKYININEKRQIPQKDVISETNKTIVNKTYPVNPDIDRFVYKQQQVKWSYKKSFKSIYDKYVNSSIMSNMSEDEKVNKKDERDLLLKSLGYVDIDMKKHHISEVKVISSNNDKIIRELDTLVTFYEDFKDKFYLPWAEVASGRAMIQSDMNSAESKLIRSLTQQDAEDDQSGHSYTISSDKFNLNNKENKDDIEMMEMALSQAFDMDPDKNSKISTIIKIRKVVDVTGEQLVFGTDGLGSILNELVTGSVDPKRESEILAEVFDESEGHHGLQAVRLLQSLHKWNQSGRKGDFVNDLTIETDAITSGMMLTLMQIVDKNSIDMLAKGGIFTESTRVKWTAYTQKWLALSYDMNDIEYGEESDIEFGPASLIEAGNFHQSIIEDTKKREEALSYREEWDNSDIDVEVYQDLYKTIGIQMKAQVDFRKSEIKTQIEALEFEIEQVKMIDKQPGLKQMMKEYRALVLQDKLLQSIGEIDPKVLRAIAKDPVMVYIYGSSIDSIKRLLSETVGKKYLIKAIKEYSKNYEAGENNRLGDNQKKYNDSKELIDALLDSYINDSKGNKKLTYKQMREDGQIITADKDNPLIGTSNKGDEFMHLDVNEDMMNILKEATDETFGDAIEDAFNKEAGSVDKYRDTVKSIELMTFELFNSRFESIKSDKLSNGEVFTKRMLDDTLEELRTSGFGHDAPTGDPVSADRRLPLIKTEATSDNGQASVTMEFDSDIFEKNKDGSIFIDKETGKPVVNKKAKNLQSRIATYLMSTMFVSNTGAAPTITIHQMDSRAITMTIDGKAWLSIYDAVVQSSRAKNVKNANDMYNGTIFEQNTERDILGDNLNKLKFMFDGMTDKEKLAVKSRLSSSEPVDIKAYTITGKNGTKQRIRSSKIEIDSETHTAKVVFSDDGKMSSDYVDVYEQNFSNGSRIIKEVYWSINKGKRNISKRVHKVITGEEMIVTEDKKENITKPDGEYKYGMYTVTYKVSGKEAIDSHNKFIGATDSTPVGDSSYEFSDLPTTFTQLDSKNNYNLEDFIESEIETKRTSDENNKQSLIAINETMIRPTLAGADFKNEALRLSLPVDAIASFISGVNKSRKTRYDNFKKTEWHIGHSAISDTTPLPVGSYDKKIENINIRSFLSFIRKISKNNIESNKKYLDVELKNIFKDSIVAEDKILGDYGHKLVMSRDIVKDSFDFVNKTGSDMHTIGGAYGENPVTKPFVDLGIHNSGYYQKDYVVTILPSIGSYAIKQNGKPSSTFKNINKVMKAGSQIVLETVNPGMMSVLYQAGLNGTTDRRAIKKILSNSKKGLKFDDAMKKAISNYQLHTYMLDNGYEIDFIASGSSKITVYKEDKYGYNMTNDMKKRMRAC